MVRASASRLREWCLEQLALVMGAGGHVGAHVVRASPEAG
jgi:hypothetical protein